MLHMMGKLDGNTTEHIIRVPDIFSSLGVNTEFQRVNSHYFHQIITNFLISVCHVM